MHAELAKRKLVIYNANGECSKNRYAHALKFIFRLLCVRAIIKILVILIKISVKKLIIKMFIKI